MGGMLLYCDGLAQPNNGHGVGTWGWVATSGGQRIAEDCGGLRRGQRPTNNVSEYEAVLQALEWCFSQGVIAPTICTDSQLLVHQVTGRWRCRAAHLVPLRDGVRELLGACTGQLRWIPRERNEDADALTRVAYAEATVSKPR